MSEHHTHMKGFLQDTFANHEMDVQAHVWSGIQQTLSAGSGIGSSSASTASVASAASAASVAGGAAFMQAAMYVGISFAVGLGAVNDWAGLTTANPTIKQATVQATDVTAPQKTVETANDHATAFAAPSAETPQRGESITPMSVEPSENASDLERPAQVASEESSRHHETSGMAAAPEQSQNNEAQNTPQREPDQSSGATGTKRHSEQQSTASAQETAPSNEMNERGEYAEPTPEIQTVQLPADLPNYLTPNGDGINDCFFLKDVQHAATFQIEIYTQAGQLVHRSNDPLEEWCGTDLSGQALPNRTICFYVIQATDAEGRAVYRKQSLMLKR